MEPNPNIHTRPASIEDKDFIISLLPRLTEFGPPSWRDVAGMLSTDIQILIDKLNNNHPQTVIFIAEDDQRTRLGFIHLLAGNDYYYKEKHAHLSDVVVAQQAEGQGIGLILISKGEDWARAQGYRWLTLSVFAQNIRARELYNRLGYGEDIMKYVKEL